MLAKETYSLDRFHTDPHNTKEMADEVYRSWMENSIKNHTVHVADTGTCVVGYSTNYRVDDTGVIDITGVSNKAQGIGVGTGLFKANLSFHKYNNATKVTVATQLTNLGAISLHQRIGFKLFETQYTLCKWVGA
jgi:hypothetical protein